MEKRERKTYLKKYREDHREELRKYGKDHREELTIYENVRREKMRKLAIQNLGGKCVVCGITDERVLQIDHINGGGTKERKEGKQQTIIYQISKGNTENYQLLCSNHNWIKRAENGEKGGGREINVYRRTSV